MELASDYADLMQCFVACEVKFIVVGAHAFAIHGRPRAAIDDRRRAAW